MEVYKMNYTFFCGAGWKYVEVETTATSIYQLIKSFLIETSHYHGGYTQKQLWKEKRSSIRKEALSFPIVTRHYD